MTQPRVDDAPGRFAGLARLGRGGWVAAGLLLLLVLAAARGPRLGGTDPDRVDLSFA